MEKRYIEIAVISDVHLGTYGCHAKELNQYLKSIQPRILILNGDILDIWNFSKSYFPSSHFKVIRRILKLVASGTQVYYITGNHDEYLRKFNDLNLGNFRILNQLSLRIHNENLWFVHGDVFDIAITHSKWLAKLGGKGYDYLIVLNRWINHLLKALGKEKVSISKKVKNRVKKASMHIGNFENMVCEFAAAKHYQYVICGHIHEPIIKTITHNNQSVQYLNSGDWIENLTSLEYNLGHWSLYHYEQQTIEQEDLDEESVEEDFNIQQLLNKIAS